jgi:osmoprotectant transport system permease protein
VNLIVETLAWFADPAHWTGPNGIPTRVLQHIALTLGVVTIAAAIAIPVGMWMGHRRRGEATVALVANGARALPTLGLVTMIALALGIGLQAPMIALVVLAVPTILAATYSAISAVPRTVTDAARSIGHTEMQVVVSVEAPLALPVIGGGIQSALLQVVATATIAAYVADVGLGRYIFAGLKSRDYPQMLAGSLLVIGLALVLTAAAGAVATLRNRAIHSERTPA